MPAPFVFVPAAELASDEPALDPRDLHHIGRVLRLRRDDPLVLCDGAGRLRDARFVSITEVAPDGPIREVAESIPRLHVLQALAKGRKLDDVVQMLVEAGVHRFTPVEAARSVSRLDGARAQKATQRWEAVARAAAAQSRRAWLPEIDPVTDVAGAADAVRAGGMSGVVAHVGVSTTLRDAVDRIGETSELVVAVGPEGGWTDDEVALLESAGLVPVRLGDTVMRTEHAAFAAVAALSYAYPPAR